MKSEVAKIYDGLIEQINNKDYIIKTDKEYYLIIGSLLRYCQQKSNKYVKFTTYFDAKTDKVLKLKLKQLLNHFDFGSNKQGVLYRSLYEKVLLYTPVNKKEADLDYLIAGNVFDLF